MIAQKLLVVDNVDNKGFLRDLWGCPASDVYEYIVPVPLNAPGTGIYHFFCNYAAVYPDHRKTHPQ